MRKMNVAKLIACLTLGICAQISATAQTADSTLDRSEAKGAPSRVMEPVNDHDFYAVAGRPVLRHHVMLPSPVPADTSKTRLKPKLRVATSPRPEAVKTGTGIVSVSYTHL